MIPDLTDGGYLPPGVHEATIEEIVERFGVGSDDREAEAQSLRWLLPMCRRAGVTRLIVGGSFVTHQREPRDVDCVLVAGPLFDGDSDAAMALQFGLPYLSIVFAESGADFNFYVYDLFASDRKGEPKGLVEVLL